MGSSPSPPTPPDPYKSAAGQQGVNVESAIAQSELNNTNQITPYGTISYKQIGPGHYVPSPDGTSPPHWVPQFEATTTLSPAMQELFNRNVANSQNSASLEGKLLGNAYTGLSKPLDLSYGATEAKLNALGRNTLDPQIAQQKLQLNQQLANQGLTPGSEGWNYAQRAEGQNEASLYNDLYLRGHQQAVSDITNQYNSPLNTLSALRSQTQVAQPGIGALAPTAQSQIQPPNLEGDINQRAQLQMQAYQQQSQNQNAMLGGLFGLGGQLIGGLGSLVSDERDKTDIKPLGKDPETGLPMSAYRYKGDPKSYPKVVGPMAQDVERASPGSTTTVGGHMVIKPGFGIGGSK